MARMTDDELIKQVLDRDAKATPGPWDAMETGRETYVRERAATDGAVIAYADATGEPTASEYALIATYRTAAPLLARKLQRAREVLEGIYDGTYDAADSGQLLDEIEAMQ